MKQYVLFLLLIISNYHSSQEITSYQKSPVFSECKSEPNDNLRDCFNYTLNTFIFENFQLPEVVTSESYKGNINVLFEVNSEGFFKVIYIDAYYKELKDETRRIFDLLPKIQPATYNGNPTFVQFSLSIQIPLLKPIFSQNMANVEDNKIYETNKMTESNEIGDINSAIKKYEGTAYNSQLNIPFTHSYYARFDAEINRIGTNSHTAAKPFLYTDVSNYYDIKAEKENLAAETTSWLGRKLWNEHLVQIQSDDYWFTVDPILDLQVGKDSEANFNSTFNNTRGLLFQGGLGKKLNFYTTVFESQGRFAEYFNQYAESIGRPGSQTEVAIIPGRGIAKRFKTNAYDYPVAEAYLSYSPNKNMNIIFGHGKNFIGDGYRSLLQSDVASPHTYLKLNTSFWKIKYTNTWMWLRDVRPEVLVDGAFLTKYMANHYLSWNVSKRLNIGLFESVIWINSNGRGFDVNYLNPIIFYRAIEFATGQDAGNAILGLSGKYKVNNKVNVYGQFILDEFSLGDVKGGEKSWKNKFGFQLGAKYYNAFNIDNLLLQAEYNQVRPYTYSHNSIVLNYAHNNQPMAHLWGANFREFILIGRYNYKRWFADAKLIYGIRGFDFNTSQDSFNYGGDIYRNEEDRNANTGITIGQGNQTSIFHGELQAGYIINPASNLRLFTNIIARNFDPTARTASTFSSSTLWFSFGVRTDLFNWYMDF